ncbi:MAG: DNA cytosine methyltransferase [Ruminococcus flavefaciens]|nr:DNA cytosine methyltransferase [Ruminococcus flavefaciens]
MIKLLMGGSPCTYWSIAKTNGRETEPCGTGWELFRNFLIAKEKFKPDFFLYENNCSVADVIKKRIRQELGTAEYIEINSALVSAQQRKRFYVHNCGAVNQPDDRGIMLKDVLESGMAWQKKSYCLTVTYSGAIFSNTLERKQRTMIAESVRIGHFGKGGQSQRIYSVYGKSVTLSANGGGQGGKTGLYKIDLPDGDYVIRKLTPIEAERLQTLPDNYTAGISNTQRYKCLGNGWTAEVIIHILKSAFENVPKNEKILVLSMYDGIATGRYCLDKMGFKNI